MVLFFIFFRFGGGACRCGRRFYRILPGLPGLADPGRLPVLFAAVCSGFGCSGFLLPKSNTERQFAAPGPVAANASSRQKQHCQYSHKKFACGRVPKACGQAVGIIE